MASNRIKFKSWNDCTFAEKVERWENVVRVLSKMTPHERKKHFDMAQWGIATQCGTVACAAGHCGMDPWFIQRGFELLPAKDKETLRVYEEGNLDSGWGRFKNGVSADDFFGYGYIGCGTIFYNTESRSVATVIKECKAYIKQMTKRKKEIEKRHAATLEEEIKSLKEEYAESLKVALNEEF
jgi:hypothetical protein